MKMKRGFGKSKTCLPGGGAGILLEGEWGLFESSAHCVGAHAASRGDKCAHRLRLEVTRAHSHLFGMFVTKFGMLSFQLLNFSLTKSPYSF